MTPTSTSKKRVRFKDLEDLLAAPDGTYCRVYRLDNSNSRIYATFIKVRSDLFWIRHPLCPWMMPLSPHKHEMFYTWEYDYVEPT
jgi:hypothetical protein